MKNVLLILGAPIWLPILIALAAVAFSIYAVLWAVIISLFAVFISLVACGFIAGIGGGIFFSLTGHGVTGLALIGCGIFCIGLSIFVFFATKGLVMFAKNIILSLKRRNCNE